jgi:hypothetical protein
MQEPVPYCAYLIRLWPTRRGGVDDFRVSTHCVDTSERQDFPDLESLVAFLRSQRDRWQDYELWEDGSDPQTGRPAPQR